MGVPRSDSIQGALLKLTSGGKIMQQPSSSGALANILLALCFFSPLITVAIIYWSTLEKVQVLETLWKPALFTLVLFWIWQSSGQCLRNATGAVSDEA
jgi:hypothetical protein